MYVAVLCEPLHRVVEQPVSVAGQFERLRGICHFFKSLRIIDGVTENGIYRPQPNVCSQHDSEDDAPGSVHPDRVVGQDVSPMALQQDDEYQEKQHYMEIA